MALNLPVRAPVAPMLAKAVSELPSGEAIVYEPKWDGFRCIAFRDGSVVVLESRNERPLTRYFPEVVQALRAAREQRFVLDGEIVIVGDNGLDFDALLQRIHPAESRVALLARSTPATFVAFDLLALGESDLRAATFAERRRLLESAFGDDEALVLTPLTADVETARDWFSRFEGAGFDGVVAKSLDLAYAENKRVMWKVKHERTADCVVAGFRRHRAKAGVGSLLLGLFDDDGVLQHVGVTSSFADAERLDLLGQLAPYAVADGQAHPWTDGRSIGRVPGEKSRWSGDRDLSFEPLRPELVCEVAYDHLQGNRFRHATTFRRWRPERDPRSCRYDQLETAAPAELTELFAR